MLKKISHVFEFAFAAGLAATVYLVPFRYLDGVASFLVTILSPIAGRAYERIRNNVIHVYPEMNDAEIRQFSRRVLQNVVRVSLEVMVARKFRSKKFILKHVKIASPELETMFHNKNKGIVCVQGHFGNWEIPVAYYNHMGVKISYSMQRLSNPYVNWLVAKRRSHYGATAIYSSDITGLIRSLNAKNKNLLGLVADQDAGHQGVFVDFMGRKASAHAGPAVMAYMAQTEMTVLTCRFIGKGQYMIEVEKITDDVNRKDFASKEDAIVKLTQAWCTVLEKKIREYPEQYFWVHRRWKTRPPEENNS